MRFARTLSLFIILGAVLGASVPAWSAANLLTDVTTKRIGTDFFVEMTFTQDVSDREVKLQYINKTIEVTVPAAHPSASKKLTTVDDPVIDHLFTNRTSQDSMRLRLVLSPKFAAGDFEKTTSFLSKGNRILLKVGNPPEPSTQEPALAGDMIDALMKKAANEKSASGAISGLGLSSASGAGAGQTAVMNDPNAKEELQPVFKAATKDAKGKNATMGEMWGKMVLSILIAASLGLGVFYFFKKGPARNKFAAKSRMIEVLSQHSLGAKKSVAVIRVAGEAVLVGITDTQISILKTLSLLDDDVPAQKFQNSLAKEMAQPSEDDFSMKGLKEIVGDRLRNMRSLT